MTSQVYLQLEDDIIIPDGLTGVTNIDGVDSTYLKTGTTTGGQEANRIEGDGDENVLWMDYDGCLKFDSTLINKDHFSISFDMKWSGANNVWYLGLWGVVGFDNNRVVVTDGDTVLTPGYVHRQFQFGNTSAHAISGFGNNFSVRDEWKHIVLTVDSGVASLYRADSLSTENTTMFEIVPSLTQAEFYLGKSNSRY